MGILSETPRIVKPACDSSCGDERSGIEINPSFLKRMLSGRAGGAE